jgi:hypothetical protein
MRENNNEENTAPAEPIKFRVGGVRVALGVATTFGSPGTNDNRLNRVSKLKAMRITPITSRLRWEGGAGARRASPRLAELVTPMRGMLTQGVTQFKHSSRRFRWRYDVFRRTSHRDSSINCSSVNVSARTVGTSFMVANAAATRCGS